MGEQNSHQGVHTDAAPSPIGPYSQAVKHAGLVYVSGQLPVDPQTNGLVEGNIRVQAERTIANLSAVLEAAGSSLDQVLRTTVFLSDLSLFPQVNAVYAEQFRGDTLPARATVQVAALPLRALLEIDAVAVVHGADQSGGEGV